MKMTEPLIKISISYLWVFVLFLGINGIANNFDDGKMRRLDSSNWLSKPWRNVSDENIKFQRGHVENYSEKFRRKFESISNSLSEVQPMRNIYSQLRELDESEHQGKPLRTAVEKRNFVAPYSSKRLSSSSFSKSFQFYRSRNYGNPQDSPFIDEIDAKIIIQQKNQRNIKKIEFRDMVKSSSTTGPFKIVCYLGAWAVHRAKPMKFGIENIDPFACTHLIYSFAELDNETFEIQSLDYAEDIIKGSYKAATMLKKTNPLLKVMISVGGWNEGGKKFSMMSSSSDTRARFITSVIKFLHVFGFDGLDLDWEYPSATDRNGKWEDKENFALLIEELSTQMVAYGFLLSAAVPASKLRIDEGYDVKRIADKLDFINVMTYDMHGSWENFADHHSPLNGRTHDLWSHKSLNTDFALSYWEEKGAPRNKLLMGIPFYGRSFTLAENASGNAIPGTVSNGPGNAGTFTKEPGFLAYYEICQVVNEKGSKWKQFNDSNGNVFVTKENQWVGFDPPSAIERKMKHILDRGYGGAMIWALDLDDFLGVCGQKWPLLLTINRYLRPRGTSEGATDVSNLLQERRTTTTSHPESTFINSTEPIFECKEIGIFASPNNCLEFYICEAENATPHIFFCQDGLHFDDKLKICNWPHQSGCNIPLLKNNINLCDTLDNGLYSDPDDCHKMFWCLGGSIYRKSCSFGLYFNPIFGSCNFYSVSKCPSGQIIKVAGGRHISLRRMQVNNNLNLVMKRTSYMRMTSESKVICYYSNWASYREGMGKFIPENINVQTCTHLFYAFAKLDTETLEITPSNVELDLKDGFYARIMSVAKKQNPNILIILSLGGWTDSHDDKYSRLVNSPQARNNFVSKTINFLVKHNFDGLSLEWQYPVCWQSNCQRGPQSDRSDFAQLIKKLYSAMIPYGMTLAAAMSGYHDVAQQAYDLGTLAQYLDIINVMAYDYHGYWEGKTKHHSPLYQKANENEVFPYYNVDSIMKYYSASGVPKHKLVLGIPLYGQSFQLRDANDGGGIDALTVGPGKPGKFTKQFGMLGYYEICSNVKHEKWKKHSSSNESGPFATLEDQWVGYDDILTVIKKANYVLNNGFGGAALWTIDLDDFNNFCCDGPYPIIRAVSRVLHGVNKNNVATTDDCSVPETPSIPSTIKPDSTTWDDGSSLEASTSSTFPSVITQPITPTSPTQHVCVEGQYYADPQDCQKFKLCVHKKLVSYNCAQGLYWDKDELRCDWSHLVTCALKDVNLSQEDEHVVEDMYVDEEVIEEVSTQYDLVEEISDDTNCEIGTFFSVEGKCSLFKVCVAGLLLQQSCSHGLHWDQSSQACNWPYDAGCKEQVKIKQNLLNLNTKIVKKNSCEESMLKQHSTKCSHYLFCVHGNYIELSCPSGTLWNSNLKVCDFDFNVNCQDGYQVSTTTISATEIVSTVEPTKTPEPPILVPTSGPLSGDYKVVCYFTNWAWYRPGIGKFKPENIDPKLCTHIVYGFAVLDGSKLQIKSHDPWADIDNKFYEKVTSLKKFGIKVLIAIGGWNDSQGDKYSRLVNNPKARKKFISHVINFIQKHNFDGLDLDWEYPTCWQTKCRDEHRSDKENFADWVHELRVAFEPLGLLLSSAVSPSKKIINKAYDVKRLSSDLDWIAVMTYDYHGHWDKKTGHVAPLYGHPEDEIPSFNTNFTINYWISQGAPSRKIVLGMPLYGQTFTLNDVNNHGLNAKAGQKGMAGPFTRSAGFLAYYEICENIKNGWKVVHNDRMGPYAYKGNQWVGYDDVDMIILKSQYIREMDLGGGMVWALDLDDFNNRCGQGESPLMNSIKAILGPKRLSGVVQKPTLTVEESSSVATTVENTLFSTTKNSTDFGTTMDNLPESHSTLISSTTSPIPTISSSTPDIGCNSGVFKSHKSNCQLYYMCNNNVYELRNCPSGLHWNQDHCDWPHNTGCRFPQTTTMADIEQTGTESNFIDDYDQPPLSNGNSSKIVVCYFTNWAWYRTGSGKYDPGDVDTNLCTHINYAFAVLDENKLVIKPHDTWADIDNNFYGKISQLKAKGIKVLLALGGWNDSEGDKYSRLVNNPTSRNNFITHAVKFLQEFNFDGLDLDWEYPKCWQVDCTKGPESDKKAFGIFLAELSKVFRPKGLLLTAAVSPSVKVIDAGYDVPALNKYLDFVNVMTYDYHGHWDKKTGHIAPLYPLPDDDYNYFNANFSLYYWASKGVSRDKLIMGMSMYGQTFALANPKNHGLNAKSNGKGNAGEFTKAAGFLSYYEICQNIKNGWTVVKDPLQRIGPYAYKVNQWVGYDDVTMIQKKSQYIIDNGFGGAMIWALDLDDFNGICSCEKYPLLRTINKILRNLRDDSTDCVKNVANDLVMPKSEPAGSFNSIVNNGQDQRENVLLPFYNLLERNLQV